jgi:hypothetical protein
MKSNYQDNNASKAPEDLLLIPLDFSQLCQKSPGCRRQFIKELKAQVFVQYAVECGAHLKPKNQRLKKWANLWKSMQDGLS